VHVIIPALNEPYLPNLLNKLQNFIVSVQDEKGLSFAVWRGIQNSKHKIVAVMDADGSHPPDAISSMVKLLDDDVWLVVGSRYCKGGYSYDSIWRKGVSLVYCLVARILLRTKLRDVMSGFWVGYKWAFKFKPTTSFKFGIELIKKHKEHIREYPIVFRKRQSGESKVKPLQAVKDLLEIFRR